MNLEISIEKTRESDMEQILELLKLVNLTVEGISKHLDHFYVVKTSGKVVGCIGLEVYEKIGLLRSLAVHPDYQKAGLGTKLTEKLLVHAKDVGIQDLYLLTSTAKKFFKRFGFKVITKDNLASIIKRSPGFSYSCETAMRKELDTMITEINGYRITEIKIQ
ncbi:MAG: GNAT family N-acetyltransferase [Candidatus Odinarchaeota archaeon]